MPWLTAVAIVLLTGCQLAERSPDATEARFTQAPVILISIDTLRADHLPAYGYRGVETPHIDGLCADSVLFETAYAHSPLTLPSHISIFTGLLPYEHGVRNNIGYRFDAGRHRTLAAYLKQQGYATAAAVSAYVLRGKTGIAADFDFFDDGIAARDGVPIGLLQRPGRLAVESGLRWIAQQAESPFLFFLHLFEPHAPYDPPEPYRSRYPLAYDGEIAAADAALGVFLDGLSKLGVYQRAIVLLLSDHGEGLSDHGEQEHGIFLYREAIHVPLLLKLPGAVQRGAAVAAPVQLIDLLPTIGQLVGFEASAGLQGRSLLATLSGDAETPRRIYSETLYPRIHLGWSELRSLIDDRYHFIQAPRPELYDVVTDPGERRDVLREERLVYRSMQEELGDTGSAVELPSAVDPEALEKLAALGYLGSVKSDPVSGRLPDPKDHIQEIARLREAFELANEARYAEAIAILRQLVEANPGFMDAWNKLALTLYAAGHWAEAIETYEQALGHDPSLAVEYALSMSSIYLKLERFEEAVSHAELAKSLHPAKASVLQGRIALLQGKPALAEQHARAALADPNEHFAAAILLAQVLTAQGRLDEAFELAERTSGEASAMATGPVQGLAFVRGDLHARLGHNREAEEAFHEEIRLFPRDRQTYANLALLLMTEGRVSEARELLEELGERNPSRETYLFAARTLETLGDRRTAAEWQRRADKLLGQAIPD